MTRGTRSRKTGAVIAASYLLLTFLAASPLVREGYIGHGNALEFLVATALTFPLSVVLLVLNDAFLDVNAFSMTGWPYVMILCELAAGAVLNAWLIYWLVERLTTLYHGK